MDGNNLIVRQMLSEDAGAVSQTMASPAAHHGDMPKATAADFQMRCTGKKKIAAGLFAVSDARPVGFAATNDWTNFVRGYPLRHIDLLFVDKRFATRAFQKPSFAPRTETPTRYKLSGAALDQLVGA